MAQIEYVIKRGGLVAFYAMDGAYVVSIGQGANTWRAIGDTPEQALKKAIDLWGKS